MTQSGRLDEAAIRWLRDHVGQIFIVSRSWLARLRAALDLRIARAMGRTKLGRHLQEYREHRKRFSLHVREFADRIEVHVDKWNPDWSVWTFVLHFIEDTVMGGWGRRMRSVPAGVAAAVPPTGPAGRSSGGRP